MVVAGGAGAAALVVGGAAVGSVVTPVTGAAASSVSEDTGPGEARRDGGTRCSTAMEERNLRAFEAYLDALLSGDAETALAYYSPDAVVEVHGSVPYEGTYSVVDGEYGALQQQYWALPDEDAAVPEPELWADCDQVILRGPFERTAVSTGEQVDTTVVEFFTFDPAGRIVRDDFYFTDTAAVNDALTP